MTAAFRRLSAKMIITNSSFPCVCYSLHQGIEPFPLLLDLGWSCDFFWPKEWERSNSLPVLDIESKRPSAIYFWFLRTHLLCTEGKGYHVRERSHKGNWDAPASSPAPRPQTYEWIHFWILPQPQLNFPGQPQRRGRWAVLIQPKPDSWFTELRAI